MLTIFCRYEYHSDWWQIILAKIHLHLQVDRKQCGDRDPSASGCRLTQVQDHHRLVKTRDSCPEKLILETYLFDQAIASMPLSRMQWSGPSSPSPEEKWEFPLKTWKHSMTLHWMAGVPDEGTLWPPLCCRRAQWGKGGFSLQPILLGFFLTMHLVDLMFYWTHSWPDLWLILISFAASDQCQVWDPILHHLRNPGQNHSQTQFTWSCWWSLWHFSTSLIHTNAESQNIWLYCLFLRSATWRS